MNNMKFIPVYLVVACLFTLSCGSGDDASEQQSTEPVHVVQTYIKKMSEPVNDFVERIAKEENLGTIQLLKTGTLPGKRNTIAIGVLDSVGFPFYYAILSDSGNSMKYRVRSLPKYDYVECFPSFPVFTIDNILFHNIDGRAGSEIITLVYVGGKSVVGKDGTRSEYNDYWPVVFSFDGNEFSVDSATVKKTGTIERSKDLLINLGIIDEEYLITSENEINKFLSDFPGKYTQVVYKEGKLLRFHSSCDERNYFINTENQNGDKISFLHYEDPWEQYDLGIERIDAMKFGDECDITITTEDKNFYAKPVFEIRIIDDIKTLIVSRKSKDEGKDYFVHHYDLSGLEEDVNECDNMDM